MAGKRVISIRATLRRRFFAGLVVTIPAIVTFIILWWFFKTVDGPLGLFYEKILGYAVPGLGFISAIVIIFIIGVVSTNVFGRKVIAVFDHILLKIPVFKGIYTAIKHLVDAFSPETRGLSFKKFVIVEYPRPGVFVFGFLMKEGTIKVTEDGQESHLRTVYIPTNNLYLGEIALFREEEVFYTNIPIEEGIRIILSAGIATPSKISEMK